MLYDSFFPPVSTLMMRQALTFQPLSRHYVPLSNISRHMVNAVIAAEDGKFCTHHGVDWQALHSVVKDAAEDEGEPSRGASTITMQTTKNLFLWNGHSYLRKALEIPLALGMDFIWGKPRTMEAYLNVAEFGPGIFGVDAAATHYFHTTAARLSPHEAALLAATLPNPKRRNPARPSSYVQSYASTVQGRMWQQDTACLH